MKYEIKITENIVYEIFEKVLALPPKGRSDLFNDIRSEFQKKIGYLLIDNGITLNKKAKLSQTTNLLSGTYTYLSPINKNGEQLGISFCARYGHTDYSLSAINYYSEYAKFPSLLSFVKEKDFSIGNIAILVTNGRYDISYFPSEQIKLVGFSNHISPKKKKSYTCLFGIRFDNELIRSMYEYRLGDCECDSKYLDQVVVYNIYYPILYVCRICGKLYTCTCFEGYFDFKNDIERCSPFKTDNDIFEKLRHLQTRPNICHLCTGLTSRAYYGNNTRPSDFTNRYQPYCELFFRKRYSSVEGYIEEIDDEIQRYNTEAIALIENYIKKGQEQENIKKDILPVRDFPSEPHIYKIVFSNYVRDLKHIVLSSIDRGECIVNAKDRPIFEKLNNAMNTREEFFKSFTVTVENEVRQQFNYPCIGEGWISETTLFKIVKSLLPDNKVVHHYRGKELGGLELDIWIPDFKVGIEYQGEQHYKVIDHWGGKEGLQKRKEYDKRKKNICNQLGYHLVEFQYNEELTENSVMKKIKHYIPALQKLE